MSTRRNLVVPPEDGPFASLGAELGIFDAQFDSVDAMSEAESGKRASTATLKAGQAAVNAIGNVLRGQS